MILGNLSIMYVNSIFVMEFYKYNSLVFANQVLNFFVWNIYWKYNELVTNNYDFFPRHKSVKIIHLNFSNDSFFRLYQSYVCNNFTALSQKNYALLYIAVKDRVRKIGFSVIRNSSKNLVFNGKCSKLWKAMIKI